MKQALHVGLEQLEEINDMIDIWIREADFTRPEAITGDTP